jgi:hypothetical protein
MRLICPACGAIGSAESWENDGRAREVLAAVVELPKPVAAQVLGYLGLFRPAARGLAWAKAGRLVDELAALVAAGYVRRPGLVDRTASPSHWARGMEQMVAARTGLRLPLTNHTYLCRVVYDLADSADRRAEAITREAEAKGESPARRTVVPEPNRYDAIEAAPPSPQLAAMLANIGKNLGIDKGEKP